MHITIKGLCCLIIYIATVFITANSSINAKVETMPIAFQFLTSDNIPIPNENFQLQINNETKMLTTRSDGLAILQLSSNEIKPSYTVTTSNQQTFNVEPNKLYRLTSSNTSNQKTFLPSNNLQSVGINVISENFQPIKDINVKLISNQKEYTATTNENGEALINLPTPSQGTQTFEVWVDNTNTHSFINAGENKYYTYDKQNKTITTSNQNQVSPQTPIVNNAPLTNQGNQQLNPPSNQTPQTNSNNNVTNPNLNTTNPETYQLSIAKEKLIQTDAKLEKETQPEEKEISKQEKQDNKENLPKTGESIAPSIFKYIIISLITFIGVILVFIYKKKKTKLH